MSKKETDWHKPIQRRAPLKPKGSCSGCFWKFVLYGILICTLLAMIYRGLADRGSLPDWARFPEIPGLPWPGKDTSEQPSDPATWTGYTSADTSHQSPNFNRRRGAAISSIVLHCTESSSVRSAIHHFEKSSSQVSAHYLIGRDGKVYQMVDENNQAWHCRGANGHTIGIEIAGMQHDRITLHQTGSLTQLLLDLMERRGIERSAISGHDFTFGYTGETSCPDMLFGGNRPQHLEAWLKRHLDPLLAARY